MKFFYLTVLFVLTGISSVYSNFTITKFSAASFCTTYPSSYVSGSFSLNETTKGGVKGFTKSQTNATLVIGFSNTSFQFNPGVGTVTASGTEVTIVSYSITATAITVTINTSSTNAELNTINFNNIEVRAQAAATGFIKRTGGTFKVDNKTTKPLSTTSWGDLTAGTPLAYSSSTATQAVTASIFTGTTDNQIIGVQVVVAGTCSSVTATSFNFNTTGSTLPLTDISKAKLYYTGTTNAFSAGTLFGSINNPNGAFTINGSQALNLGAGTYYFWLTYDISSTALPVDVVDAQFVSTVIAGTTFTTASGNPTGNRAISNNVFYSIAAGNWSSTAIWSRTSGGISCSCAPTGGTGFVYVNHAVSLDNTYSVNNVTVQNGGNLTNASTKILTVTNTLATSGTGIFSASSAWILNNVTTAGTGTSSSASALTLTGSLNTSNGSTFQMTGGAGLTINGNITTDGTLALGTSNVTNSNAAGTIINGAGSITGSGTITLGTNKTIPVGSNLTISPVMNITNGTIITNNGTVNIQNDITGGGVNAKWSNAANSVLNMGGTSSTLLATGILDASAVPNAVNYNSSGDQTIKTPSANYYNLYVAGTGIKSLAGAITVNNDIQISTGAQLNAVANSITLNGNWINNSINAAPFNSTGTVNFNGNNVISGTGITSFNNLTITSTGSLTSNSSAGKVIVSGDWVNDGDFTHNSGDIIFNGTSTISGASATGFNTVIVNASKTLTLHSTETDIDANLTVNGTLNHNNGLIVFTGSANTQNINGVTTSLSLYQAEISNTAGTILLSRPVTINNLLTLTAGNLNIGSFDLTLAATVAAVGGSPFSASNMIIASGGGQVIKNGTSAATASFTFPVGDNTGTLEYSPVTVTFNAGTYTSGSASVKVINAKNPNNTNTTNYLNRYWTITTTGYSVTSAIVTTTYTDADIVGSEAGIVMGRWSGLTPWEYYASSLNFSTNTLTSPALSAFGDFTGISDPVQWTGNVSTDWTTAGNWSNGVVPTAITNVTIPSTATRMPSIVTNVNCNSLVINSGATLTNTVAGTLNIAGILANNGTFLDNGTTGFMGTSGQQTFSGVAAFNNLTLNNTSGLLLPAAITITGNLTLTAGILNTSNFNIDVKGNWVNNASTTSLTAGTATVTFSGTNSQIIGGTFVTGFNNLNISNTGSTVTLNINAAIAGDLSISAGTFNLGVFTANRITPGGTLTVANNATLEIGGTNIFPVNYTTNTLVVASTVAYSGTDQTIANQTYGNLALSSSGGAVVKTFPPTAMTVVGNLSSTTGAGTSVTFTAVANITVSGNVSIGTSTTFNGGSYIESIGGNWINNGIFNGNTGTVILTGSGTSVNGSGTQNFNNLTIAASLITFSNANITLSGNLATISSGSFSQASGGILSMTGSGKTISGSGILLDNLSISGSVSTATSFDLTGNLSVSGSFSASSGTITMGGALKTISGTGTLGFAELSVTGSITTNANFSISSTLSVSGSLSASAGTVTFTGTSSLSGTANLFNTIINGTSLQLAANSIMGIANTMTIIAGTLNTTSTGPNTVNFNGAGAQNINAITYSNLVLSGGSTKTAAGSITTAYDITIGTGTSFEPSTYTHSIYGSWINNGTFIPGTSTIQFLGAATSYITGVTTFNILTSNTTNSTTELILNNNISASIVNMTNGIISTGTNTLSITNTRTGNGYIYGNIQRTHSFATGIAYAFEGPNNSITFTAVTGVTSITVSVTKGTISDFPYASSISRLYNITVPSGTYTATLRLHYEDDELNGNSESTMGLWNYYGSLWIPKSKSANNITSNYVEQTALTNITNRWSCSSIPTVVQWNGSVSSDWNTPANWTILQGSATLPPGPADIALIGTTAFNFQPTISTAATAKNIVFGSVQAATLSMAGGGSLITGDVLGVWSGNLTHTINVNNQSITINGDLTLGDGTANHVINLNTGSGTVTVNGSINQLGGAAIAFTGAGNLNIDDNYNKISGTFTAGTSTVTYSGVTNQVIGTVTYNNLTINKAAAIATINNPLTVGGNLTVTAGQLDNNATTTILGDVTIASNATIHNGSILHIGGNWVNNGSYTDLGTNVIFDGSGTQTIASATFNNLTFNKPVGASAVLTGNIIINGDLTITSGTLNVQTFDCNRNVQGGTAMLADSASMIIGANNLPGNFSNYSLASSSTVIFDGAGTQTLSDINFGHLILRNAGTKTLASPITVDGNLTIENGSNFDAGSNTITLNGSWINNGTFTPSASTVLCTGTSKNISGNTIFNHMTVTGSYTILSDITFNGLLNITSSGSLSGGGTIHTTMNGDLINSGILYTLGTTTFTGNVLQTLSLINAVQTVALRVNFNGSVSPVLNSTSTPQFGYLAINNTGGVNPSVGWTILYSLTVGSGASFNGGNSTHNILGAVNNNGTITSSGTLNFIPSSAKILNLGSNFSSTGMVVFGGAGAITLAGTPVFNNVNITNTNSAGITASSNWNIANKLTVASGSILNAGNYDYLVGGNISNSGTINSGTSTFILNGAGAQSIYTMSPFNNLTINSGSVTAQSDITINNSFLLNNSYAFTIGSNTLTLNGTINGNGTLTGSTTSNLTIGGTAGNLGTLNFTAGSQVLNTLTMNRTGVVNSPAAVLGAGTDLLVRSLALQNGILATGNNLFTWDHSGGTLTAPNTPFSYNIDSSVVKASFIALCDVNGNPVTATDGSKGFRVNNVGNTETWFPIGYNFSSTPNRMTLQNAGTVDNYTVSLAKGDIGNTALPRVNRIWHVTEGTPAGSSVTMKLFFFKQVTTNYGISQDEVETGFNYGDIHLVHKIGNFFQNNSNSTDILSAIGRNDGSEIYALYTIGTSRDKDGVYNGITSFSPFSVINAAGIILPVNIINLKAYQQDHVIKIDWTSLDEINIDHYEIQRSTDGIRFNTLGSIPGMNTASSINYHYTDLQPVNGNNFYRIKAVDKDGSVKYTQVVNVNINSSGKMNITVYPNPVNTGSFNLVLNNLEKGRYNLQMFDNLGHYILSKLVDHPGGSASQIIYLPSHVGQGVYQLLLSNDKIKFNYSIVVTK